MRNIFRIAVVSLLCSCAMNAVAGVNEGWITESSLRSSLSIDPAVTYQGSASLTIFNETSAGMEAMGMAAMGLSSLVSDDISELAAALEYDPVKIYEFVRNNIDYECRWGWMRSPDRTIADRMGTDADQAVLLVELLHASGYADAQYAAGFIWFPQYGNSGYNMGTLLGTDDIYDTDWYLNHSEIPYHVDTNNHYFLVYRFWVNVTIDSVNQNLDPAFKPHTFYPASDIPQMCGYARSNVLASVGAAISSNEVLNLDEDSLREHLDGLAGTLVESLESNYPNGSVQDMFGGVEIVPETGIGGIRGTLYSTPSYGSTISAPLHYINFIDTYTNAVPDYMRFSTKETGCRELSVIVDSGGVNGSILLDGSSEYTGSVAEFGITRIIIQQPYTYLSTNGWQSSYEYAEGQYQLKAGSTNAFVFSLGNAGHGGLSSKHVKSLRASIGDGGTEADSLRSSLHSIGDSWMNQFAQTTKLIDHLIGGIMVRQYTFGQFVGSPAGDYVDIRNILVHSLSDNAEEWIGKTMARMMVGSALEHGVLEQSQPNTRDAVSTVDVLTLASRYGMSVYHATSNTFDSIKTNLVNYTPGELWNLEDLADNGFTLILPEDAKVGLNSWTGLAYIATTDDDYRFMISDGLNGGFDTTGNPFDLDAYYDQLIAHLLDPANNPHPLSPEPVDMVTGAYVFNHEDLSMDGPLGLSLSRKYSSQSGSHETTLGYGWSHSLNMTATRNSDPGSMLGLRTPQDAAPLVVALYAMQDLVGNEDTAKSWMTSVLIAKWAMDQLTGNAVTIATGQSSMTFIEQPDGSYTPPPGMAVSLSETNNAFTMQERHGNTYEFNTNHLWLHRWVAHFGGRQLHAVADGAVPV